MRSVKLIRWGVETAATEFGINPRTLSSRIRTAGLEAGKDGKFSTAQIASAVYGDIDGEKLRLTKEQADKLAIENAESRGTLISVEVLIPRLEKVLASARQRILSNVKLDDEEKDKLILELRECLGAIGDESKSDDDSPSTVQAERVV